MAVYGWTDYPLMDENGVRHPRSKAFTRVEVMNYDGDKYCTVRIVGYSAEYEIKRGYLYVNAGEKTGMSFPQTVSHNRLSRAFGLER